MAVNSSSIVSSLGAGSGIDIKNLAQSLVEAERKPFKDRIDEKVSKSEAKISGYGAILSYLKPLKESFTKLKDASGLGALALSNSQSSAFTATAGSNAIPGSYTVNVLSLASAQRSRSVAFDSDTQLLDPNNQPFNLQLSVGGAAASTIQVSPPTPQGMVDAITADSSANAAGIKAQLVRINTNGQAQYVVELQGRMGADQAFSLAIDPASYQALVNPPATPPVMQQSFLREASDARVMIEDRLLTSASNTLSDGASKLSLDLSGLTTAPAKVGLTRDVQAAKESIKSLVASYNDFQEALKALSDRQSEVETLGGSLAGDRLLQSIRTQMRTVLQLSDSSNTDIKALSGLGITVGLDGRMAIKSEKTLESKLNSSYGDVLKLFTSSTASKSKQGLVGDALDVINGYMPEYGKGQIQQRIDSNAKDVTRYKDQLTQLEARLAKSLERYMNEFSIMESMVGNSNSVRAGLKNSLGFNSNQ
jgi:flagellar hook-associated protein 2